MQGQDTFSAFLFSACSQPGISAVMTWTISKDAELNLGVTHYVQSGFEIKMVNQRQEITIDGEVNAFPVERFTNLEEI